jgi:hypothetical protein
MSRQKGDRDLARDEFLARLAAADAAMAARRARRASEADRAALIGISRTTLWSYRLAYGVPRPGRSLNTQGRAAPVPSQLMRGRP